MKKNLLFFSIGIGDCLMSLPAVRALVKKRRERYYAFCINPVVRNILINSKLFEKVYFINFLNQNMFRSLLDMINLRKEKFDLGILLFPANHYIYRLVLKFIVSKIHFHKYIKNDLINLYNLSQTDITQTKDSHSSEENYKLLEMVYKIDLEREYKLFLDIEKKEREDSDFTIGIHAGSDTLKNLSVKRWPYYRELIKKINQKQKYKFKLFGAPSEYSLNESIAKGIESVVVIKEKNFFDSAREIKNCDLFISNDSGLLHTAVALGLPTISIFGPTNYLNTKPLVGNHRVISLNLSCSPCYQYSKNALICTNTEKYACMTKLEVDKVYKCFKGIEKEILK
ncbi:MAG: hypothetical protein CR982_10645 [Candidatus Cloacimonadota bacterium]|nr:MAG: hypothetical protein CR982_10645 [Candidatus Cloacimonadota bacterium]PIE78042.1 MAG: hypothetical protein CSA15_09865 [Candidatus Delongbacteria bacterium]